jgi:preprotein translocase subunit SecG
MSPFLTIIEIVISVLIIGIIIVQSRGSASGMAFGGQGETYRSKKGIEKVLFYVTIILAAFFALVSILALINQ